MAKTDGLHSCRFILITLLQSAMQGHTGRMVGAMYLGMAVQAAPTQHKAIVKIIFDDFAGVSRAGMSRRGMALLAK